MLEEAFAPGFPVTVIWDRRREDRRQAPRPAATERRRAERRAETDALWNVLGIAIVEAQRAG